MYLPCSSFILHRSTSQIIHKGNISFFIVQKHLNILLKLSIIAHCITCTDFTLLHDICLIPGFNFLSIYIISYLKNRPPGVSYTLTFIFTYLFKFFISKAKLDLSVSIHSYALFKVKA